jgi:hypothetical protein
MYRARLAAVLIAIATFPVLANDGWVSGNGLLADFQATDQFQKGYAMGFAVAMFDASDGTNHCAPPGLTQGQIRMVAQRYLESNPQMLHEPARPLLLLAYREAFPCSTD